MDDVGTEALERRLLILAPFGKDAALIASTLAEAAVSSLACRNLDGMMRELERGAAALLVAEEVLDGSDGRLVHAIAQQPPWSDLPVMLLTRAGADSQVVAHAVSTLGNVTLLERPVRIAALVAAARGALRARARQYEARAYLAEREKADRRKDEFLATMAHELRNPLAPIRYSLDVLRMTGEERCGAGAYDVIDRQVGNMVRLIDDLMDVSRITRGKVELHRQVVELTAIVEAAVETSRPLIEEAKHELTVTLPGEPIHLSADPLRLGQVFANLLNNAAKFTERGGRISIDSRRDGDSAVVTVSDTGIGLSAESLSRVFDMFAQAHSGAGFASGLGIGLALARSLVEMHGGSITATSAGEGKGATFTVRLPIAGKAEPRPRPPPSADAPRQPRKAGQRILVVDDNRDSADALAYLLETIGADVHIAYDGRAALEALRAFAADVALIDLRMPDIDGYELARRIRSTTGLADITLIAYTGWGQPGDRERTREAGFDHHLVKPVEIDTLQALLESLAPRSRAVMS